MGKMFLFIILNAISNVHYSSMLKKNKTTTLNNKYLKSPVVKSIYKNIKASSGHKLNVTIAQLNHIYNVKNYGVMGDGVHDDTEAIDRCSKTAGKNSTIYFPQGVYIINSIYSNFTGQKFIGSNADIKLTANNYGFIVRHDSVTISGFNIIGTGVMINSFAGSQIILQGASHCIIANNRMSRLSSTGIYLSEGFNSSIRSNSACSYNIIDHNKMYGPQGDHGWGILLGYSNDLFHEYNKISNNIVDGQMTGSIGISLQGNGKYIKITGNFVRDFSKYGIVCYAKNNSPLPDINLNNVLIENNTINNIGVLSGKSPFGSGIYVTSADNVTIINNTISNTTIRTAYGGIPMGGISINVSKYFVIKSNVIDSSAYAGINLANVSDGVISSNIVKHIGVKGMGFANGKNLKFTHNHVFSQGAAIQSDNSENDIGISENELHANASAGIYLKVNKSSSNVSIINNLIDGKGSGIFISGIQQYIISKNSLKIKKADIGILIDNCTTGQIGANKILSSDSSSFSRTIQTIGEFH